VRSVLLAVAVVMCLIPVFAVAQDPPRTSLVILGTGTPNTDPERSGPATAVVVDNRAFLIDAGPGVVRRAAKAARDRDIPALEAQRLNHVFITHLHSDHTVGLPDLLYTPWVLDRPDPLRVLGPPGIQKMMDGIGAAWADDIELRINGLEPREHNRDGYRPLVTEVLPGLVFEDDLVRVFAFRVDHGSWENPYAYRFEGPDRSIVISGDTAPAEAIVEACNGCDILLHEVYSAKQFPTRPPEWQRYHSAFHTSTTELAELATRAGPRLLVLYHQLYWSADDDALVAEIRAAGYMGPVVSARDLDVY
jgi:ribonuclease BN (tRNA processing enzyme)